MKLKKDIIDELEEKLKNHEKLEEQVAHYQETISMLSNQIELKDNRIDQLLNDNSRLVNHIIDCPYRKECKP